MRKHQIGSSGMCLYFTEAPLSWNCIVHVLRRTTVCAYLCFSLCKPWDGTLYIDLRSLRARHEDWIFIKQFSNYKSFLCLLVKNFRNYFNWTKFLKKNFVIRGKSLRVEGVEESGPQNTSLPLSLGGSSRPLMRYIDLHIGEKMQRFDLYIKPADTAMCWDVQLCSRMGLCRTKRCCREQLPGTCRDTHSPSPLF